MDEAERRRAAELLREIRQTGNENQGGTESKITWMYKGPNDMIDLEEYLLGKAIDKTFGGNNSGDNSELIGRVSEPSNVPKRLLGKPESAEQVDIAKKILEDPLYAIKQKELEARRKLLDNPVKLKELKKMIMERNKKKLERKKQKKRKKREDLMNDENALNKKILKKLRIFSESHRRKLLEEAAESSDTPSESDSKRKKSVKRRKAKNQRSSDSSSESNSSNESEDSSRRIKKRRRSDIHRKKKLATREKKIPSVKGEYKSKKNEVERIGKGNRNVSKCRGETNRTDKRKSKTKRSSSHSSSSGSGSGSSSSSSSTDSNSGSDSDSSDSEKSSSESSSSVRDRSKKKVKRKIKKDKDKGLSERKAIHNRKSNKNTGVKTEKNSSFNKEEKKIEKDKKDRYRSDSYSNSDRNRYDKRDRGRYREDLHAEVRERSKNSSVSKNDTRINDYSRSFKERSDNASSYSTTISEKERERKLREMMEDAKVRKEEREKNLAHHRKIQREEEKQKDYDDEFMRRQISHATSKGTVADRIKSNVNNIQRAKDDMDSSFLRK